MSLIQVSDLYKSFNGETLFENISFNINEADKIGLIGINGSGKSTLIKIILGMQDFDTNPVTKKLGSINKKASLSVGYLSQHSIINNDNSVFQELMNIFPGVCEHYKQIQEISNNLDTDNHEMLETLSAHISDYEINGGYKIEQQVTNILLGLEVAEDLWQKKISTLSGGQKTKVSLCAALLSEPELLILDEPTNHLDINAIIWLENFLINYKKAVLLISHDIYFLDNTINKIFEIEGKTLKTYKGNYTEFKIQKDIYLSGALKLYEQEQKKIEKLKEFVLKYKAGQKSKQARGRQKMLNNMDKMDNPIIKQKQATLKFEVSYPSSKKVLEIKNLAKAFNEKNLFKNLNLYINKGDRIGIIGRNGVGKSTLLKIIMNHINQDNGSLEFGDNLNIGYYSQDFQGLNLKNTLLEEIQYNFGLKEEEARSLLGQMLFSKDDVFKKISALSGGEKARIAFLKLILQKPNLLILDEPTNHLDIYTKELLENALTDYNGTILVVSHDRYFIDMIVTSLYIISEHNNYLFDGNYEDYINENINVQPIKNKTNQKEGLINTNYKNEHHKLNKNLEVLSKKEEKLKNEYVLAGENNNLEKLIELQNKIDIIALEIEETLNKILEIEEIINSQ